MANSKGGLTTASRTKWIVAGALALSLVVAQQAGWVGYGWAELMASTFPRDESLLGYVPNSVSSLAIIDPHQLDLKALGGDESAPRRELLRVREDVKRASGIDLATDADKIVLTPSVAVIRGRFDAKKLAERLAEHRYTAADHKGVGYLVRAGEDAIAVVDGSVLLYGSEADVKAAIDAKQVGTSVEKNDAVTGRLRRVGWDHALLVTVGITDEKPSLRAILAGSSGPKSYSMGIRTVNGLDVNAVVESASAGTAEELRKLLDEKRAGVEAWATAIDPELGKVLAAVSKRSTITVAPGSSDVTIKARVEQGELDTLVKKARTAGAPLAETYKTFRLYQLLVP